MRLPAWLKPAKFAVSIAIYSFTFVWLLTFVSGYPRLVRLATWVTAGAFAVEMVIIAWAAAVRPELGARAAEAWAHAEQLLAKKRSSPREAVTVASALRTLEKEVFPC